MAVENPIANYRVLVVDDEQGVLNAVRRELVAASRGAVRYEVETCSDPLAALALAREQSFDAVLSDYRMPQMDGLTFLKQMGTIQPDCARLVLSGQTDMDALVRMINETHIYRFIPKPWSSYFMKSSLFQAIELNRRGMENRRLAGLLRARNVDLSAAIANTIDQVLVVDDDVNDANAVARCLTRRSRLDDVFHEVRKEVDGDGVAPATDINPGRLSVQITDSPQHGLHMADAVGFACVIADYRMPVMDGAQFLAAFAEKQPDCMLMMVSGEANLESVVIALDLAHIYAFIAKPWVDYELRAAVAQGLMRRRLMLENRALAQLCRAHGMAAPSVGGGA